MERHEVRWVQRGLECLTKSLLSLTKEFFVWIQKFFLAHLNVAKCKPYTTWTERFTISLDIGGWFKNGIDATHELGQFESISYKEGSIVPDAKTLTWADLLFDLWKNVPKSIDWNPKAMLENVKTTYNNYQKVKSVEYASAYASTPSAPAWIATGGST